MSQPPAGDGVYYFLGNITSHILHALPLYKQLGGTFVVLSEKAKQEVATYNVPVINLDNKPRQWVRFSRLVTKTMEHYQTIGEDLHKTTDFLNKNARVVIFYELFDFAPRVRLTNPSTIFLTHGFMLKDYMAGSDRLHKLEQYDFMAAVGPYLKKKFIEQNGIDPHKLLDIGIARTDEINGAKDRTIIDTSLAKTLEIDVTKPVISYMPTFWGASSIYDTGLEIIRNLPPEYTLLFRPHPQTPHKLLRHYQQSISQRQNIKYVPEGLFKEIDLPTLFSASSAIIGDVSSVMAEAILTDKPLLFAFGQGQNRQSAADYEGVRAVIEKSEHITADNVNRLGIILREALAAKLDTACWQATAQSLFFDSQGGSAAHIARAIRAHVKTGSSS